MELIKFLEKLEGDKALAAKYEGLDVDAWLEQARKDGCTATKEDLLKYEAEHQTGELSNEKLASVAGGGWGPGMPWKWGTEFR